MRARSSRLEAVGRAPAAVSAVNRLAPVIDALRRSVVIYYVTADDEASEGRNLMRKALCVVALALATPAYALACSPSDIKIKQADLVREEPSQILTAVGEFVNNCADPVFVRFHITVRDRSGRVVASNDSWPSGDEPVPAHGSYAFDLNAADEPDTRRAVQSMTIDIVSANTDGP
jgi:hypothetical protein